MAPGPNMEAGRNVGETMPAEPAVVGPVRFQGSAVGKGERQGLLELERLWSGLFRLGSPISSQPHRKRGRGLGSGRRHLFALGSECRATRLGVQELDWTPPLRAKQSDRSGCGRAPFDAHDLRIHSLQWHTTRSAQRSHREMTQSTEWHVSRSLEPGPLLRLSNRGPRTTSISRPACGELTRRAPYHRLLPPYREVPVAGR